MESDRQLGILMIAALMLIALVVFMNNALSEDANSDLVGAEFLVS